MNLTFTYSGQQTYIHNIPANRVYYKVDLTTGKPFVNQHGNRYQLWTTQPIQTGFQPNVGGNVVPDINFANAIYTNNVGAGNINLNQVWSDNNDIWYAERF